MPVVNIAADFRWWNIALIQYSVKQCQTIYYRGVLWHRLYSVTAANIQSYIVHRPKKTLFCGTFKNTTVKINICQIITAFNMLLFKQNQKNPEFVRIRDYCFVTRHPPALPVGKLLWFYRTEPQRWLHLSGGCHFEKMTEG